jgi:hypothetical protein
MKLGTLSGSASWRCWTGRTRSTFGIVRWSMRLLRRVEPSSMGRMVLPVAIRQQRGRQGRAGRLCQRSVARWCDRSGQAAVPAGDGHGDRDPWKPNPPIRS